VEIAEAGEVVEAGNGAGTADQTEARAAAGAMRMTAEQAEARADSKRGCLAAYRPKK